MLVGGPVAGGEPGPGDGLLAAEGEGPQLLLVKHRVPDTWAQWSGVRWGYSEHFNAHDLIQINLKLTAAYLRTVYLLVCPPW